MTLQISDEPRRRMAEQTITARSAGSEEEKPTEKSFKTL